MKFDELSIDVNKGLGIYLLYEFIKFLQMFFFKILLFFHFTWQMQISGRRKAYPAVQISERPGRSLQTMNWKMINLYLMSNQLPMN